MVSSESMENPVSRARKTWNNHRIITAGRKSLKINSRMTKPPGGAVLDPLLEKKYGVLQRIIKETGKAAVAFSGGVDSTFLFKVCVDVLGDAALAITARSETYPMRELEESKSLAKQIGGKQIIIESAELDVPGFSDNPPNRCFLCKSELFTKAIKVAKAHGIAPLFDGNNVDDADDFRPGRIAAKKLGVRSPLEEAGLTKKDIRSLSRSLGLPTWDKPAFACLSSRFPYHTRITKSSLALVEKAEGILWDLGMREFRVRHHGKMARIELGTKEMKRFFEQDLRKTIVSRLKSLGYAYVTLDLEGYRTGSMNETLTEEEMAAHHRAP
jgi:uncharacterized protein